MIRGPRASRALRGRPEFGLLGIGLLLLVAGPALLGRPLRLGEYGVSVVQASSIALQAAALVVVYRATRIINFGQLYVGVATGLVFTDLIQRRVLLRSLRAVCHVCVNGSGSFLNSHPEIAQRIAPDTKAVVTYRLDLLLAPAWAQQVTYLFSALLALAFGAGLIWVLYSAIIRRFNEAPKLVLTVITIAAGQLAILITQKLSGLFLGNPKDPGRLADASAKVPSAGSLNLTGTIFGMTDLLSLVLAVVSILGLAFYLRRSSIGIALRGAAENPQRAQTLGVNVEAVAGRAWLIAGALSSAGAVLGSAQGGSGAGAGSLVPVLAAAVVGAFVSLPLAVVGAGFVAVATTSVGHVTGKQAYSDVLLLVLIVGLLLLQRSRSSRAEQAAQAGWVASRESRPIPPELRHLPVVRRTIVALAATSSLFVLGSPWLMSDAQISTATTALDTAVVGVSLLVLVGWAGQISLGQFAFAALGAYVTAVTGAPFPLALLLGAVAGAASSVLIGLPALRLKGLFLAITTLVFATVVTEVLLGRSYLGGILPNSLRRPILLGVDFEDGRSYYYLSLAVLAGVVTAVMGLRRSRTARVLIAAKDNEQATQTFGVNLLRVRLAAFAISGAIAACGGVLFAYGQHGVIDLTFSPFASVQVFLMVVIGGLGSIAGPILGAVYLAAPGLVGDSAASGFVNVLSAPGLGVILLLLFAPGGLNQLLVAARDGWLRRIAARRQIIVPSLIADTEAAGGLPIAPNLIEGNRMFVPQRFRLDHQWMVQSRRSRAAETLEVRS